MEKIMKSVDIVLTEEEINSVNDIEIKLNIYSEKDPNNEEGVTYTINYPKS
tara:strand:+ start:236 stop:388 length:153 start_codon:yes stop_codon:yes gene_type:complete